LALSITLQEADKMNRADFSQQLGDDSENLFFLLCEEKNYNPIRALRRENKYEHWDIKITNPEGKVHRIDVKAIREGSFDTTWLELVGITGKDGSLLGLADYFAFQQRSGFIYFRRVDLLNWFFSKVGAKFGVKSVGEIRTLYSKYFDEKGYLKTENIFFAEKAKDALYNLYSRKPWNKNGEIHFRHDITTKVSIKDMKRELKWWTFK
jgi:hypothetical protein